MKNIFEISASIIRSNLKKVNPLSAMPKNIHHLTILQDSNKPAAEEDSKNSMPVVNNNTNIVNDVTKQPAAQAKPINDKNVEQPVKKTPGILGQNVKNLYFGINIF